MYAYVHIHSYSYTGIVSPLSGPILTNLVFFIATDNTSTPNEAMMLPIAVIAGAGGGGAVVVIALLAILICIVCM